MKDIITIITKGALDYREPQNMLPALEQVVGIEVPDFDKRKFMHSILRSYLRHFQHLVYRQIPASIQEEKDVNEKVFQYISNLPRWFDNYRGIVEISSSPVYIPMNLELDDLRQPIKRSFEILADEIKEPLRTRDSYIDILASNNPDKRHAASAFLTDRISSDEDKKKSYHIDYESLSLVDPNSLSGNLFVDSIAGKAGVIASPEAIKILELILEKDLSIVTSPGFHWEERSFVPVAMKALYYAQKGPIWQRYRT